MTTALVFLACVGAAMLVLGAYELHGYLRRRRDRDQMKRYLALREILEDERRERWL